MNVINTPAPFAAVDVSWNRFQEDALLLQVTAGTATIQLGPNFSSADAKTGLVNDALTYSFTARIDGTDHAIALAGSAMQTVTALVAALSGALAAWATVTLNGDTIVITSLTTGPASAVFVSDTTVGTQTVGANAPRLFKSITGGQDIVTIGLVDYVAGSPRFGVMNYDSSRGWFNIAGSTNRVGTSERGNNMYLRWDKLPNFEGAQEAISDIVDRFLAAAVTNTNQPWVNAAAGIAVTGGVTPPTSGTDSELLRSTVYQLQVNVNGAGNVTVYVDLNIPQTTGAPFDQVVAAINAGLAATRQADGSPLPVVAEWQQGLSDATLPSTIVFRVLTSNTLFTPTATGLVLQGATSSLVLTDGLANGLVAALTATATFTGAIVTASAGTGAVLFNRVNGAAVTPATVPAVPAANYDFTVAVDGLSYDVTVAVTAADSMTVIAASMEAALNIASSNSETVDAVGNMFVIVSDTTGFASTVEVTIPTAGANADLFNAIAAALDVLTFGSMTTPSTLSVDGFATPGVNGATNLVFPKTYNGIAYSNWLGVLGSTPIGGRLINQYIFGPTGMGPIFTSDSAVAFEKENRPQATGQCVYGTLYWDSVGGAWHYFVAGDASRVATDDTSAGTNNPPRTLANGV